MSDQIHDPVHRATYSFQRDGDNLTVETLLAAGGGLPPHSHPRQEERWSVVEGEVRFRHVRERRVLTPADGEVVVRPGELHALASTGGPARLSCYVVPALGLEEFLTESAAAAREGLFIRGGIPTGLRGLRWAATFLKRHRADVVLNFPPRFLQRPMIALFAERAGRPREAGAAR